MQKTDRKRKKKMENTILSVCHVNIYFSSCYIFDEVTKKWKWEVQPTESCGSEGIELIRSQSGYA